MFTLQALLFILLLVPGFLSHLIIRAAVPRREIGDLVRVVEALMLALLTYAIFMVLFPSHFLVFLDAVIAGNTSVIVEKIPFAFLLAMVISLVLSLGIRYALRFDLHTKLLRKVGAADLTSRISIWHNVFLEKKRYVIVTLGDGRRISGWPEYYSETEQPGSIYLFEPFWIDERGQYQALNVEGILLTGEEKIRRVEFMIQSYKKQE